MTGSASSAQQTGFQVDRASCVLLQLHLFTRAPMRMTDATDTTASSPQHQHAAAGVSGRLALSS